jgi:hypothetical protein
VSSDQEVFDFNRLALESSGYPWSRKADESNEAYEAFRIYISTPYATRSYSEVARILEKSQSLIDRWGAVHEWQERSRLYDNFIFDYMDRNHGGMLAAKQLEIVAQGLNDYKRMRALWQMKLDRMLEEAINDGDVDMRDIDKLAKARATIESVGRKAAGMPEQYKDYVNASDTEDEQLTEYVLALDAPLLSLSSGDDDG